MAAQPPAAVGGDDFFNQNLVFGQSCAYDTVTPKKVALRAEIFNNEIMEALLEPDDEDISEDDATLANRLNKRT